MCGVDICVYACVRVYLPVSLPPRVGVPGYGAGYIAFLPEPPQ